MSAAAYAAPRLAGKASPGGAVMLAELVAVLVFSVSGCFLKCFDCRGRASASSYQPADHSNGGFFLCLLCSSIFLPPGLGSGKLVGVWVEPLLLSDDVLDLLVVRRVLDLEPDVLPVHKDYFGKGVVVSRFLVGVGSGPGVGGVSGFRVPGVDVALASFPV